LAELSEDERTTPIGLFNYATSYWKAAKQLHKLKVKSTHPNAPISFLYFHAIELYLKSFLRLHGIATAQLRSREYGHSYKILSEKALEFGISYDDEDIEVLSDLDTTDAVIRARYLRTGILEGPAPEALDRTCKSLGNSVADTLRKAGIPVRY
jgi:HEPN domain-containing protein